MLYDMFMDLTKLQNILSIVDNTTFQSRMTTTFVTYSYLEPNTANKCIMAIRK